MKRDTRLNNYLRALREKSDAIKKIYPENEIISDEGDSLNENSFEVLPGFVHKFAPSVVILLTGVCGAQCSFCERLPKGVGDVESQNIIGFQESSMSEMISYMRNHVEIKDVIFSGGDPFLELDFIIRIIEHFKNIAHIATVRIHTKYPLQNPVAIKNNQLSKLSKIVSLIEELGKIAIMSVNTTHSDEFTLESEKVLRQIRKIGFIMISQTVFLKGVNGDEEALTNLFLKTLSLGIVPYYLYHCQSKPYTHDLGFVEDINVEIEIVKRVLEKIPGIARPKHVIDIDGAQHESGLAAGKVVIAHHFSGSEFTDFKNRNFSLNTYV